MNRFSNYIFPNGQSTKNRIVVPPMASQTASVDGYVTPATRDHYRRLAEAGAGLVFVEYSFVHRSGRGEPNQLGIDRDDQVEGLAAIATDLQSSGALAGIQLVHVGGKSTLELTGGSLISPSGVPVPVKGWQPGVPSAMTLEQVVEWQAWFLAAARRAVRAGFDVVELHAAHGYGFNQWLSPLTNHRTDRYGGTSVNRMRILTETVTAIRQEFPNHLLSVRVPGQDHLAGGLTLVEMAHVVAHLESAGVNLIDVSSGIGGWRRPEGRDGEGYLVADAAVLRAQARVPVIGVGGIETGSFIDQILNAAQVDFAAVGRAILKNPLEWRSVQLNL